MTRPSRSLVLLALSACASTRPAPEAPTSSVPAPGSELASTQVDLPIAPPAVDAPALSADALIADAGMTTYLEDHGLLVATIEGAAMERWFVREPDGVFLYAERTVELAEGEHVAGACQRVARVEDGVLNGVSFGLWRHGTERVVLEIGQERITVVEQEREHGVWDTRGVRSLPMGVIAWDDAHIAFAEGAEIHETACVHTLRAVPCEDTIADGSRLAPRGHCVDRSLVVRPWRAPTVPHVGDVIPAYRDEIPTVPPGACTVTCAPSACDEALGRAQLPRVPLYASTDPVLAIFRTQAACRAFASSRAGSPSNGGAW